MIKTFFFLPVILLASVFASTASAVRHVGSGGGISEQNLVFAFENTKELLQICYYDCGLNPEAQKVIQDFVQATGDSKEVLVFHQDSCQLSKIQDHKWNLCLPEAAKFDLDLDSFLDLQESTLMLFHLYSDFMQLDSDKVSTVSAHLLQFLKQKSFNYPFLFSDGFQFQIFGYLTDVLSIPEIYVQSENSEPLKLTPYLSSLSACAQLQLTRPYLALDDKETAVRKSILVFPTVEYCGTDSSTGKAQKRIIEIHFLKDSIQVR
jgi:hypothetical protein